MKLHSASPWIIGAGALPESAPLGSDNPSAVVTPISNSAAGTSAQDLADVCKSSNASAQPVPVDVFMMIDQSLSMVAPADSGQTHWDAVIGALTQFVQAPESAGLELGVQYFGVAGSSCEPTDYATAEVEIAPLPENAQPIINSFAQHGRVPSRPLRSDA